MLDNNRRPRVGRENPNSKILAARLAAEFEGGRSVIALASKYKRRCAEVRALLAKAGVRSMPSLIGVDADTLATELAARIRRGETVAELYVQTGLQACEIRSIVWAATGTQVGRGGPGLLDGRTAELVELHERGLSIRDIAAHMGCAYGTARRALLAAEVELRRKGRAPWSRSTTPDCGS